MVFLRLWHVAEDPGGGERENSTKLLCFSAYSCCEFMMFVRLGHVAETPAGGECENSTKFCVFLRTVVAKIHGVRSSRARCRRPWWRRT